MANETLGARLRAQRERQQVTLATIAEQTKIKLSLLEGLEADDVSQWPAGIYRRGYLRAYARAIGLDPDTVLRDFLDVYPDPPEPQPADEPQLTRLRYLFRRLTRDDASPDASLSIKNAADAPDARRLPGPAAPPVSQPSLNADSAMRELATIAESCTRMSRAASESDLTTALATAAEVLGANGVIVWLWDPHAAALVAVMSHGYSKDLLARLPSVPRDADNAIGSVFRSADAVIVEGRDSATGAVVAPLMTPAGCTGVLAIELPRGSEGRQAVRAFAVILAAQLAAAVRIPAAHQQGESAADEAIGEIHARRAGHGL